MKIRTKIFAGFALGLAMIALLGVMSYESGQIQIETNQGVWHTYRVIDGLEKVLSVLKDAETGQRGFILTGEDRYLDPYNSATTSVGATLDDLAALTTDDPDARESVRQIRSLAAAKLEELRETIQLRKQGDVARALAVILTDRGKRIMDEIRAAVGQMKDHERRLLDQQTRSADASTVRTRGIILIGAPVIVFVLAVAAFVLSRDIAAPLTDMARAAQRISEGELSAPSPRAARGDEVGVLQESFARMNSWLMRMRDSARCIAGRDLSVSIEPQSERDELGISFAEMVKNLREMTGALQDQKEELSRQNQELTQRSVALSEQSEELARQNDELQSQGEELESQNEELRLQSEEIQELNSELAAREKLLQRLLESVGSLVGEQQAVAAICASALEIFGESAAAAVVLEMESERLRVRAQAGIVADDSSSSVQAEDCSFARLVIAHDKTAALDDASLRPDLRLLHGWDGAPFKSVIASPLRMSAGGPGAVAVYGCREQKWTEDQFRLVEWLAAQCSLALEIVRLQDDLRRQMALMDLSPDGIMGRRVDGTITLWGHGAEVLYGWTKDEAIGGNSHTLLRTEFPQPLEQIIKVLEQSGRWSGTLIHTARDGRKITVASRWLAQRDAGGEITELLESNVDITERQIAEESLKSTAAELKRSNQELEQFAYVTSHDLQEPLRQVRSFVQLLRDRHLDKLEDKAAEYMKFIVEGTARMGNLVQDLLAYSRVSARETQPMATSCLTVLAAVLANLQGSMREAGANVTYDELPTLQVDPVQLTQLLQNLIGNAVKFRREGIPPEIHVGVRRNAGRWLFSVRDNGIGIDSEHFNRIFLIFQRLHGREKYSGTGIGLAICKKIVEQYGGRIWVESQVGAGATFYFTLPAEDNT